MAIATGRRTEDGTASRSAVRPFREAMNHRTRRARYSWQVFGLAGPHVEAVHLVAVASQPTLRASAIDGVRSCIPLRDSPGLSLGSLSHRTSISVRNSMP